MSAQSNQNSSSKEILNELINIFKKYYEVTSEVPTDKIIEGILLTYITIRPIKLPFDRLKPATKQRFAFAMCYLLNNQLSITIENESGISYDISDPDCFNKLEKVIKTWAKNER